MGKSFQFPVWLKGTVEEQAAESARQADALAIHSRAHMSEQERLIGRGKLLEDTARLNLELSAGRDKEARILAENQLADAMFMQGKIAEAAEAHNDAARRKYFREVGAAIEKPDDDRCSCPDVGDKQTPRFERTTVFSPVHGEVVSLVECQTCGDLNARPLRSRLIAQKAMLNQTEVLARSRRVVK